MDALFFSLAMGPIMMIIGACMCSLNSIIKNFAHDATQSACHRAQYSNIVALSIGGILILSNSQPNTRLEYLILILGCLFFSAGSFRLFCTQTWQLILKNLTAETYVQLLGIGMISFGTVLCYFAYLQLQ